MTTEFEQAKNPPAPVANEFQAAAQPTTPDPITGEWTQKLKDNGFNFENPEDIAKKAFHADQHIANLEAELKGLREDLDKRLTVEENLERANQLRQEEAEKNTTPQFTQEDVAKLVKDGYSQLTAEQKAEANLNTANEAIVQKYGQGKGAEAIAQKAQELNLSVDQMISTAQQSPQAFFNLMGMTVEKTVETTGVAPASTVNSDALAHTAQPTTGKPGTKEYFDAIKKSNPREYWSPKVQGQIHEAHRSGTYQI